MAWYDEAVFYHIYPLGLTGAPRQNDYGEPVHRLNTLLPWIGHLKSLGFTALYIGPLFQSVGHGYETTDYRLLDSRLGTNEDLKSFVSACHREGLRVIFDGVFNHTGRDFFAFRDIQANREASPYRDWYCNVNFWGNNEYNDGFSYDNWGGYNLLVKLNQRNPAVRDYICDVIRFWVSEFDVDGIRLDAADVLDFEFMKILRRTADEVKPEFWLMGEVIHGDYSRWANEQTLHSVTNYALHKALYSGHNDHNYFEIAHTVQRTNSLVPDRIKLYNFVDNHDVERIHTKLMNKAHFLPVHILLYTLPGIPSVYYGSEFGIDGRKERGSDDSLRPCIDLNEHRDDAVNNPCTGLIAALGRIHREWNGDLVTGDYRQLFLTTQQYAFQRGRLIVAVNNSDGEAWINVEARASAYVGLLSGRRLESDGRLNFCLNGCSGEIFAPDDGQIRADVLTKAEVSLGAQRRESAADRASGPEAGTGKAENSSVIPETKPDAPAAGTETRPGQELRPEQVEIPDLPYELMTVEQLQAVILSRMAKNGPVTERMRRDVIENIWHDSLVNWANSFR
ncbi:MAG: alpha-amylase [Oscillospiraceae bacterium]|nr:alpha-amylase [Oscillospiraceae bacterium]